MILVETCPKCGHDLIGLCLDSYPPQYVMECFNCGWRSKAEQDEIIRVPYQEINLESHEDTNND